MEINKQVLLRCSYSSGIKVLELNWYRLPIEGGDQQLIWKYQPGRKNEAAAEFSDKFMFDDSDLTKEHRIRIDPVRNEDQATYRCTIDTKYDGLYREQASLHVLGEYKT